MRRTQSTASPRLSSSMSIAVARRVSRSACLKSSTHSASVIGHTNTTIADAARNAPRVDARQFRTDLNSVIDQSIDD